MYLYIGDTQTGLGRVHLHKYAHHARYGYVWLALPGYVQVWWLLCQQIKGIGLLVLSTLQ